MPRPSLLVPVLAIVALLAAAPAATAATNPEPDPASIEFELDANNGMHAYVEAFDEVITLSISNKRSAVSYEVKGESTEAGLKAQFGELGLIEVTFKPTKTLDESEPPKQCKGEPWINREGLFTGTIQFTGEREYVRVEATRAKGKMIVTPEWRCPEREGPVRLPGGPPLSKFRAKPEPEADIATLNAHSRQCRCGLLSFALRGRKVKGSSFFFGTKVENREGMKIERATFAKAGPAAFTFNHKAGTARLDPPHPFTGTATFKRRPGRDLWRSTLQVPLLGADPVSLRGRSFGAHLARDLPGD